MSAGCLEFVYVLILLAWCARNSEHAECFPNLNLDS